MSVIYVQTNNKAKYNILQQTTINAIQAHDFATATHPTK